MANRMTMTVEGLRELDNALAALPVEIKRSKIVYRALHDGARVIVKEAKRMAPLLQEFDNPRRQRGAIRDGITQAASRLQDFEVDIRVRNRGYIFAPRAKSSALAGNPNYWWLVEFGTSKMAARPFLRPAFEARKFDAINAITDSLRRGIRVVTGALGWKMAA